MRMPEEEALLNLTHIWKMLGLTLGYGTRIFGINLLRQNIKYQLHIDGLKHKYFTSISDRI
jgi:hypothetical protein